MPFLTGQPQNRRCPPQIDPAACCRRTNANRFCSMLLKNLRRDWLKNSLEMESISNRFKVLDKAERHRVAWSCGVWVRTVLVTIKGEVGPTYVRGWWVQRCWVTNSFWFWKKHFKTKPVGVRLLTLIRIATRFISPSTTPESLLAFLTSLLSGTHPGYSCKEGERVEDGFLLEFPCTPTRTRFV
jgi:hypothetical protein